MGTYTGQFGFLLVEGKGDPGHYDQEVFLAVHHWEPSFVPMVEMMQAQSANNPKNPGSDVGYKYATINQHRLGAGDPLGARAWAAGLGARARCALPWHAPGSLSGNGSWTRPRPPQGRVARTGGGRWTAVQPVGVGRCVSARVVVGGCRACGPARDAPTQGRARVLVHRCSVAARDTEASNTSGCAFGSSQYFRISAHFWPSPSS